MTIRILSWIPFFYPATINKLKLPRRYIELERLGRWRVPPLDVLAQVFPEPCSSPCFYGRHDITLENNNLEKRSSEDLHFLGMQDKDYEPGDIRPSKAVLIGDLGVDRPFALDYRLNIYDPTVIYLRCTPNGSRWVRVADTFDDLAVSLGL